MANWTNEPQPFGANRAPLLAGLSNIDGVTPVPVAVDPTNGQLQTNSSGGGGGGSVTITSPIGQTTKSASVSVTLASDQGILSVQDSVAEASLATIATNTTGVATSANQITGNSSLSAIATNTSGLNNTVGTAGSALPTKGLIIQGSDGTNVRAVKTDTSGNVGVNVQGTVPVSGTFWQTTQPVSLATNTPTLQSGSTTAVTQATASNLNATIVGVGSAGTPSGGVVSIQGVTSGTAIPISGTITTTPPSNASTNLTQISGSTISLSQKTMSSSFPVALASDQNNALETGGNLATIVINTGNSSTSANQTNGNQRTGTSTSVINVGQQTVSTSAVQISSTSTVPTNGILVGALSTNSASIFIGGSGVTTSTGAEITPGSSLPFTCNLNTLYIRSVASTTDKVWFNIT